MDVHIRVDLDDDGPVVVKSATGAAGERLRHEHDRLRRAAHPGVVALVDGGADDDMLVMRYAGEPVARWSGSPAAVAGLGAAVASTLADLHDVGIVHGRLDGSHILIGHDGRPRLCGLSHAGDAPAADDVAALGAVLDDLLSCSPTGRRVLAGRAGRRAAGERRALHQVIERAIDPVATRRPSARALADAVLTAVPAASLPVGAPGSPFARQGDRPAAPADRAPRTRARRAGLPLTGPAESRRTEPDTLDRIWAYAGDETDDERWAAALGPGPPDLPLPPAGVLADRTEPLPVAEIDTPGWPDSRTGDHPPHPPDGEALPAVSSPWPGTRRLRDGSRALTDDTVRLRRPRSTTGSQPWNADADTDPDLDVASGAIGAPAAGGGPAEDTVEPHRLPDGAIAALAGNSGRPATGGCNARESAGLVRHTAADRGAPADQLTRERQPAAGRVAPTQGADSASAGSDTGRVRRWAAVGGVGVAIVAVTIAVAGGAVPGSGGGADTPRPEPQAAADCPAVDGPAADVDGDGCREALVVDGATVDAGVARWALGVSGDVATVGDWDCDGEASAALLRPATGDVFVFAAWAPVGEPVTVRSTRRVDGAIAIRSEPDSAGCDRLLVDLRSGGSAPVEVGS